MPSKKKSDDIYEMSARVASGELGLRERHKVDKLNRIANATLELFAENGYEGTTLRAIASRADVALGTLSLYAEDKRDLIVMLFNKSIPPLMDKARDTIAPNTPLVEGVVNYFEPFYRAYAKEVTLYRLILSQLYNRPTSAHAQEHDRIRERIMRHLTTLIQNARDTGEIDDTGHIELQARSIFYLYFATVRLWLVDEAPKPKMGLKDLEAVIEQQARGMGVK